MNNKKKVLFGKERRVWIKTFGCQMNYHDTERVLFKLSDLNFKPTKNKEEADLALFNTCAIRELANMKFYSQLGELKKLKAENPDFLIGILGCVSQIDGEKLMKKYKHLDFAIGTDVIDQIDEVLFRSYLGEKKIFLNSFDRTGNYSIQTKITHNSPQAFVNIMKGCNNFCSYCIVPYTRGREVSKKIANVVEDVRNLVRENNIQEITLLGQNVNSFGKENKESFQELLKELENIEEIKLIRYTTSHPRDMSDELIKWHGKSKKLAKHLHLPIQSGSNSVLKRMNRGYTKEDYLLLLLKLRESNPEIVISSDIIVGFPNETDAEFADTMELLLKAQFDFIFSFRFSRRPGTKAYDIKDNLSEEIKKTRLIKLQKYQLDIQSNIRKKLIGKKIVLLVDGISEMNGVKKWKGRSNCNRIVHFTNQNNKNLMWKWIKVEIIDATALSLQGKYVSDNYTNRDSLEK